MINAAVCVALVMSSNAWAQLPIATTLEDFFQPGSQPDVMGYDQFLSSANCGFCHGASDDNVLILSRWQGSMMAQAARDPLFYACLAVAEQDATFVGDICIRCHSPRAWISGRSSPTDGSAINVSDRDGINCHVCHRLVDPIYKPGVSPAEDLEVLNALADLPVTNGGGDYVLDRLDRRRGKRPDSMPPHSHVVAPFTADARLCETCHDVSNPAYVRQPDGTYDLGTLDEPHPTNNKFDMFPLERTFSEWLNSDYANGGVDAGGLFGGNLQVVSTCQDCHLPDSDSQAATNPPGQPLRTDLAAHDLSGGNTWVQDAIINLYPGEVSATALLAGKARAMSMLERASTLELTQVGDAVNVRIINECGHKLPSGYPEGRRMWINVRFFDGGAQLIEEHGAYNSTTADLTTSDTKVYEIKLGVDAAVAALTGLPEGPTFHFAINNKIYKDNRIPARGFANQAYRDIQASPVHAFYADGRYWDDTQFAIPLNAASATIEIYFQTTSKEYVTFLHDENTTNTAGQTLYDQWELTGKAPPVLMQSDTINIAGFEYGDFNDDQSVDADDLQDFLSCLQGPDVGPPSAGCEPGDLEADQDVDVADVARFQRRFGT